MMQTKAPAPTAHAEPAAGTLAQRSVSPAPGIAASSGRARPQAMTLQRLQQTTSNSARVKQLGAMQTMAAPSQHREAAPPTAAASQGSGLPPHLKHGIENLSGISMDGVTVHYNSAEPAQLRAHAFAQGSDIHLGPGQEAHLPHEAWHVVQQAQGRVKPTFQMKTGLPINDDAGLENEADAMGARALSGGLSGNAEQHAAAGMTLQRRLLQQARQSGSANTLPVQAKLVVAIRMDSALAKPEEKLEITDFAVTDYSEIYRSKKIAAGEPKAPGETKEVVGETTGETKEVAGKTKAVDPVLKKTVAEVMKLIVSAIHAEAGKEGQAGAEGKEIEKAFTIDTENIEQIKQIERQLGKWIENAPGTDFEHNKIYGRKQQYRIYDNYYDLARGLLGWVLAKPARKEEQKMANEVYGNVEIARNINSLMERLGKKIASLTDAPGYDEERPVVENLRQKVIRELRSSISETSTAREAGQTELDHLGTYRHHFDEEKKTEDVRARVKTGIANNQYQVIERPFLYSLRDKIVVLHDVMEYFGGYQSWLPPRAGQDLLPEPEARYRRSTTSIHTEEGPNKGTRNAHTADDGKDADGKPDQGRGKKTINLAPYISHATRDERHPTTLLARKYKIPIWSGQSFTAMRMFGLADWVGANIPEKTALAWAIFAFWRKDYDHRAPYAAHTLHEVMDIAQNFDVAYSITDRQGGLRPQQLLTSVDVARTEKEEIDFLEDYIDNLIEHIENRYAQFEDTHYGRMPEVALAVKTSVAEAVMEQRGRSDQRYTGTVFGISDVLGVVRKSEKLAQKVQSALMEAEAKEAEFDAPEIPDL